MNKPPVCHAALAQFTVDGVAVFEGCVQTGDGIGQGAYSSIRLRSTSESGPVGASRSPSQAQNRVLSVFGVYSVSRVGLAWSRGLEGRLELPPYSGLFRTRDSSDSGVLLFVFDGRRLAEG